MNTVLIVFLALVIIIAIYLAIQFYNPFYLIKSVTSLNIVDPKTYNVVQPSIPITLLDNPSSVRYFYEGWFFINENSSVDTNNVLFNRGNNFIVTLKGSTLNLYVNTKRDSPINSVNTAGILDTTDLTPLASINNFPFQKWAHLVINVDGSTVDIYIDGKFVKNVQSKTRINVNATDSITYGNQYTLGYFTKFRRPDTSINPQGVWSSYMKGSGQSNSVSGNHVNLQFTKNNSVRYDQRLF
jgi:hypothetical protein